MSLSPLSLLGVYIYMVTSVGQDSYPTTAHPRSTMSREDSPFRFFLERGFRGEWSSKEDNRLNRRLIAQPPPPLVILPTHQNASRPTFPHGHKIVLTESDGLKCGASGCCIAMQQAVPRYFTNVSGNATSFLAMIDDEEYVDEVTELGLQTHRVDRFLQATKLFCVCIPVESTAFVQEIHLSHPDVIPSSSDPHKISTSPLSPFYPTQTNSRAVEASG